MDSPKNMDMRIVVNYFHIFLIFLLLSPNQIFSQTSLTLDEIIGIQGLLNLNDLPTATQEDFFSKLNLTESDKKTLLVYHNIKREHSLIVSSYNQKFGNFENQNLNETLLKKMLTEIAESTISIIYKESLEDNSNQALRREIETSKEKASDLLEKDINLLINKQIEILNVFELNELKLKENPLRFLFSKITGKMKNLRTNARLNGASYLLTLITAGFVKFVVPPFLIANGMPILASKIYFLSQPFFYSYVVSQFFNYFLKQKHIEELGGIANYNEYINIRDDLYKGTKDKKIIDILQKDKMFSYRYRSKYSRKNLLFWTNKNFINFNKILDWSKNSGHYKDTLKKLSMSSLSQIEKTKFFLNLINNEAKPDALSSFRMKFENSFIESILNANNDTQINQWIYKISQINNPQSFIYAIEHSPEKTAPIIFFEIFERHMLEILAESENINFENFRNMIRKYYQIKFKILKENKKEIGSNSIQLLSQHMSDALTSIPPCSHWTSEKNILFKFLKGTTGDI